MDSVRINTLYFALKIPRRANFSKWPPLSRPLIGPFKNARRDVTSPLPQRGRASADNRSNLLRRSFVVVMAAFAAISRNKELIQSSRYWKFIWVRRSVTGFRFRARKNANEDEKIPAKENNAFNEQTSQFYGPSLNYRGGFQSGFMNHNCKSMRVKNASVGANCTSLEIFGDVSG